MAPKPKVPNEKIRYQRELRGWSQQRLAELLGTNMDRVSRWECGESSPSPFYREKLCVLFGKDAEELGLLELQGLYTQSKVLVPDPPPIVIANKLPEEPLALTQGTNISSTEQRTFVAMDQSNSGDFTRRQVLSMIVSVPFLSLAQVSHLLHHEEVLSICNTNILIAWRLYFDGHLSEAESVLAGCLSQLSSFALQLSPQQKWAASLASKGHQLACMLELQFQRYGAALMHTKQAIQHGQVAEDPNLQVASLTRKALVYFYLKRPEQRLDAYQDAMQYIDNISPLLRGRVFIGLAEAHSNLSQEDGAMRFLDLAYSIFPENPKDDPNFSYTYFKFPQLYEGLVYLNLNQSDKTWETLNTIDKAMPSGVVPDRVELSLHQARASIAIGNLEQSYKYLDYSVTSALALNSTLRYNEA